MFPTAACVTKGVFPYHLSGFLIILYFLPTPAFLTLPSLVSTGEVFHFIFWQWCWFLKILIISVTSDNQFPGIFLPIFLRSHLCNYRQRSGYFSVVLPSHVLHNPPPAYHQPPLIAVLTVAQLNCLQCLKTAAFPSPIFQLSFGGCRTPWNCSLWEAGGYFFVDNSCFSRAGTQWANFDLTLKNPV